MLQVNQKLNYPHQSVGMVFVMVVHVRFKVLLRYTYPGISTQIKMHYLPIHANDTIKTTNIHITEGEQEQKPKEDIINDPPVEYPSAW